MSFFIVKPVVDDEFVELIELLNDDKDLNFDLHICFMEVRVVEGGGWWWCSVRVVVGCRVVVLCEGGGR